VTTLTTLNAAIYARLSVDKRVGTQAKSESVGRQIEHARAYATTQGWSVRPEHIFADDGISGAEFDDRRPGLQQMVAAAQRGAFRIVVVSEQKSLGREQYETNYTIKRLAQAGVEVWAYMEGRCLTPRNAMDKAMSSLRAFGDEAHREDTSKRGHEAHSAKQRRGHIVGGRVYGFRNVDIYAGTDAHGRPLKSHVERVIDPTESAVVRRIFELYDSGLGLKAIAKQLTSEKAPAPIPFVRKDPTKVQPVRGWYPSTIRAILRREDYRGVYVWNRTRKRQEVWGKVKPSPRPDSEWQRTSMPDWRIVSDDLWRRVAARRADTEGRAVRFAGGRISGRPPKTATQNLLAGLATCAQCGGGLIVETAPAKRGRVPEYVCFRHRANGTCDNTLRMPVADINDAVLQAIEEHALTPEAIEQVIHLTERDDVAERQTALARERRDLDKRIARLVAAVETAGDVAPLVEKLRILQARRTAIDVEATALRPVPRLAPAVIESRLTEWRRLLRSSITQGRTVLQRILRGRLTFTPHVNEISGEVDGYSFDGPTRYDRLFSGLAVERPRSLDPTDRTGTEDIGPEDTFDGDYGRLLDRAYAMTISGSQEYVKGVASPPGFEPGFQP
jgi:site-specific DNA recombinase